MSAAALADRAAPEAVRPQQETLLVYRHLLAPPSEVAFLRRFYLGFERLRPVWLGCRLDAGAGALTDEPLRLGRVGPLGVIDRALFRHGGILPPAPDLRALRPALLHAHFGRGGALALPIARALNIPLVVTFHGGDATKERHYRRRLLPPVYQRRLAALTREAALFVCVSGFVRDRLLARGFPAEKLTVIHQGVELAAAPATPAAAAAPPDILFVGRFVEKKGAARLIEAARILRGRGSAPPITMIGDGPLAARLREQASGLAGLTFPGWLSNDEVRRRMRSGAIVCIPSLTAAGGDAEGLPTVIFEAMAEGAALVASRHAGIAEAVEHGENGLLVPEGDPAALADALEQLIRQPELRRRLGRAARRTASERFDAVRQSRRLEEALLRAACAAKR